MLLSIVQICNLRLFNSCRENTNGVERVTWSAIAESQPDCDSAIEQHLLKNGECVKNYEDTKFLVAKNKLKLGIKLDLLFYY